MAIKGLKIQDFADMEKFESIMRNWAKVTGLAAVVMDAEGKYVSEFYNKGMVAGLQEGVVVSNDDPYRFSREIEVDGIHLGAVVGGKAVSTDHYDDDDVDNSSAADSVQAAGDLLGIALNEFLYSSYIRDKNAKTMSRLSSSIAETNMLVKEIQKGTNELQDIQRRQKILALNANIEAARAGENGKGFGVVADEVGRLSENSSAVNEKISGIVKKITDVVSTLSMDS